MKTRTPSGSRYFYFTLLYYVVGLVFVGLLIELITVISYKYMYIWMIFSRPCCKVGDTKIPLVAVGTRTLVLADSGNAIAAP